MKKTEFRVRQTPEQQRQRQAQIALLRENPAIIRWMEENKIPDTVLESQCARIALWEMQNRTCQNCPGLDFCTRPVRGQQTTLTLSQDGLLDETFTACPYLKTQQMQQAHCRNFLYSHMKKEDYMTGINGIASSLTGEDPAYIKAVRECALSLQQPYGLFFYGEPGSGKSYLLMAAANDLARKGLKVSFVRVPFLMAELKETLQDKEHRQTIMRDLRNADVLFLDDFGSENISAWTRDGILFPLLDERMNRKKKTYFASNLRMQELLESYTIDSRTDNRVAATRLMDRVKALAPAVYLPGHSRRKQPGPAQNRL